MAYFEFCAPEHPEDHAPVHLGHANGVRLTTVPCVESNYSMLSQPSTYGLQEYDACPSSVEYTIMYNGACDGCRVYEVRRADKVPVMFRVVVRADGTAYFERERVCKPVRVQVTVVLP